MEDGAVCARQVSGTLREGVGRIVSRFPEALVLYNSLELDA